MKASTETKVSDFLNPFFNCNKEGKIKVVTVAAVLPLKNHLFVSIFRYLSIQILCLYQEQTMQQKQLNL